MKIAINGFGRIGRLVFRKIFLEGKHEIVAVNDLFATKHLAYLLEFDSAQGRFCPEEIEFTEKALIVRKKKVLVFAERDPKQLPWKKLGIDLVVEATGFFRSKKLASQHLIAGARKVAISAPASDDDIPTIVYGINHQVLKKKTEIISGASCTTNCVAPLAWVLDRELGIKSGLITTIHAVTNDQRLLDLPHEKLRRGRAAISNIVPTTTGAAVAVGKVLPHLDKRLDGKAIRVPVISGSLVDCTFFLNKTTSVAALNQLFASYAQKELKHTLQYARHQLVSSDIIGSSYGSIFDPSLTTVIGTKIDQMVKIFSWYDNEMSYVSQLVRTINYWITLYN